MVIVVTEGTITACEGGNALVDCCTDYVPSRRTFTLQSSMNAETSRQVTGFRSPVFWGLVVNTAAIGKLSPISRSVDAANALAPLSLRMQAYITGQILHVDGGFSRSGAWDATRRERDEA